MSDWYFPVYNPANLIWLLSAFSISGVILYAVYQIRSLRNSGYYETTKPEEKESNGEEGPL